MALEFDNGAIYREGQRVASRRATNAYVRAQYGMKMYGVYGNAAIMQAFAEQAPAAINQAAQVVVKAFASQAAKDRGKGIRNVYQEVGEDAVGYIAAAYDISHAPKATSGYRAGNRYSGGALRRALGSNNMFRASSDGLDFINVEWLDRQARQWHRLNFGAGGRGNQRGATKIEPMRLFGEQIGIDMTLRNRPSKPFTMPQGMFFDSGGTPQPFTNSRRGSDAFYVRRREPRIPTAGIAPSRFLEMGVKRINSTIPKANETLIRRWAAEARRTNTGPIAFINPSKTVVAQIESLASREIRAAYQEGGDIADFLRRL